MNTIIRSLVAAGAAAGITATSFAGAAQAADSGQPKLDLGVHYTVSTAKLEGEAGTVAVRLDNEGAQRYFGEFPLVTFEVKIVTAKGPEGVNRNIRTRGFNGAHVEDLGFDAATSTRTYRIILSNPVEKGVKNYPIAAFDFGIGGTREGQVVQKIVTTQTRRLPGDEANANDQGVDSSVAGNTFDDFGHLGTVSGLF